MSIKLHIPQVLIDTTKASGYPPMEDILTAGAKLMSLGFERLNMQICIPDGPRSVSFYRSPNCIHFDIEGCYTVLSIKDDEVTVELLPDELMESLYKLSVREFHRRLHSL